MISFQLPWLLALLPLPFLVRAVLPPAKQSSGGALRVPFFQEVSGLGGAPRKRRHARHWVLLGLMSMTWLLLVGAAARPQWLGDPRPIPTEGRDLMLAVDISGSMGREDFTVEGRAIDRLSVVRAVARKFALDRDGDRLGLVLFGSRAYLQAPLTYDRDTVAELVGEAELGLAGKETAIGDAIGLAVKHLRKRPSEERVLVLLSDGASNAGVLEPRFAADLAKKEHVRIYTIGVGADRMAMDTAFGRRIVDPAEDLDEETLEAVAQATGGKYFRAKSTEGLIDVYRRIDELEPTHGEAAYLRPRHELFQWPLGVAFALTALIAGLRTSEGARYALARLLPSKANA